MIKTRSQNPGKSNDEQKICSKINHQINIKKIPAEINKILYRNRRIYLQILADRTVFLQKIHPFKCFIFEYLTDAKTLPAKIIQELVGELKKQV